MDSRNAMPHDRGGRALTAGGAVRRLDGSACGTVADGLFPDGMVQVVWDGAERASLEVARNLALEDERRPAPWRLTAAQALDMVERAASDEEIEECLRGVYSRIRTAAIRQAPPARRRKAAPSGLRNPARGRVQGR